MKRDCKPDIEMTQGFFTTESLEYHRFLGMLKQRTEGKSPLFTRISLAKTEYG
jgi:hypothetical protein